MKVGDLVRYDEEMFSRRGDLAFDSSWLGVVIDENPKYYFVIWMNRNHSNSKSGVCELKNLLKLVS